MSDADPPWGDQETTRSSDGDLTEAGAPRSEAPPLKRLGDFELIREIGRGGMGVVYEARQVSLKRRIALKVLPPALGTSGQAKKRFEREAQAAAKLHHTNIVPVHAIGEDDGHHFYAMDLIEGQSLDHVLRQLVDEGANPLLAETVTRAASELPKRPRPPTESKPVTTSAGDVTTSLGDTSAGSRPWIEAVATLIAEVADGLDYAHGRGVIHRDIKPANLMLSSEGRLCITDFGLARIVQEPGMTVSGSILGTPAYMSPEQIAAGRVKLDHRTDVYSLGAVLYESLTLHRPFPGDSREEVLSAIMTKDPRPPRKFNGKIPQDLETICLKALEKDPDRRYATAGELAHDLRQYLHGGLIAARRAGPLRRTAKFIRRHPLAVTLAAAALAVALLGSWAWQLSTQQKIEVARRSVADARYFLSQGEYREALKAVDAARTLAPDLPDTRLMRARVLMMLGRDAEAAVEAEALLAGDPDDWTAHLVLAAAGSRVPTIPIAVHLAAVETHAPDSAAVHYLGSLLIDSPGEAIESLDRALELDPGHAAALLARAQRNVDLKDFPAALRDGERLAAIRPRSAQGRRMIAWVHYNLHDPERALAEYERAIQLDPDDPLVYLWRAWVHKAPTTYRHLDGLLPATGKMSEAIADLTRALELDPDYAVYHRERADAYYQSGRYEDAIHDARRAIELDPTDLAAYNTWGYACLFSERREEIQTIVEQMTAMLADWTDRRALADGLANLALGYQAVGQLEKAQIEADRAIEVAPDYYQVYFVRQWLRRRTGDVQGAEADLVRAASVELSDPAGLLLRGSGLSQAGHHDPALADFDRAVELAPQWADPYHLRAHLTEELGRFEESLTDYDRAISLAPRWVKVLGDRGRVRGLTKRFDAALADFEAALEIDGQSAAVLLERADLWLRKGRIDFAFADIDRVVERNPDDAWAHATRARALFLSGQVEEALAAIELAIEREPGTPQFYLRRASYRPYSSVDCAAVVADVKRVRELVPSTWIWVAHSVARIQVTGLAVACPQTFDPASALESARTAADAEPRNLERRVTLGLALYRHGRFREARDTLLRVTELRLSEAEPWEFFALAMAGSKMGSGAEAREYYDRAVARMNETYPRSPEYILLRQEAARVLGIQS